MDSLNLEKDNTPISSSLPPIRELPNIKDSNLNRNVGIPLSQSNPYLKAAPKFSNMYYKVANSYLKSN